MPVDCATWADDWCAGCNGGYTDMLFEFYKNKGLAWEHEYPYHASQGTCQMNDWSLRTMGYVVNHGYLWNEAEALAMMEDRPFAAYFAVKSGFFSYSSGIIKNGDNNCELYPGTINHAMAVVGVDLQEEPDQITETVLHARWNTNGTCDSNEFTMEDYPDFCLWEEERVVQTVQSDTEKYWKI